MGLVTNSKGLIDMRCDQHVLLTPKQMALADQEAVYLGVPAFDLMAAAGQAVAEAIMAKWTKRPVLVMAGPGNNGGDGFVIAEQLRQHNWPVTLAFMGHLDNMSAEAQAHAKAWKGEWHPLSQTLLNDAKLVVDALFGAGLSRPIEGQVQHMLEAVAQSGLPVCAVDVPSGLDGATGQALGVVAKADLTVTFFRKKPGHLLFPGRTFCGDLLVRGIGIPAKVLTDLRIQTAENHPDLWLSDYPLMKQDGHKFHRGHVLIYGGQWMTGASRLSARAAQRIGAGLVSLAVPESSWPIYAAAMLSVMVKPLAAHQSEHAFQQMLNDSRFNVVVIGPGAGLEGNDKHRVKHAVLETLKCGRACVLDADALTAFSERPKALFEAIHDACILTPHEGEFARLFPHLSEQSGKDKLSRAKQAARESGAIVLLKGADTVIASPDGHAIINTNAPAELATGGAGDVLAGFIAGLVAQGMTPFYATAAAVWLHGEVANEFGVGLIAEDLTDALPNVLQQLK
ncbi:NAD(P)H-hydrate epimerase [Marinomonas aquiplantarum]|uniref:Bifunctional NAD(P)H-hydrate repair enzyme n=2 Tax=Marinomonas aquiplantarum TaxID=491951 RepID=A0A366D066_9GAMM|nr:NAD(P)H-hydrate epimerase [Marinomonas aquiplantarum]